MSEALPTRFWRFEHDGDYITVTFYSSAEDYENYRAVGSLRYRPDEWLQFLSDFLKDLSNHHRKNNSSHE